MNPESKTKSKIALMVINVLVIAVSSLFVFKPKFLNQSKITAEKSNIKSEPLEEISVLKLDVEAYNQKLNEIANNPPPAGTSTQQNLWPVKTSYPNTGALLPFNRIVAYYGNLYSKGMGILGEYPEDEVVERLNVEVKKWELADPKTPVIPALHYIAVVAQAGPGRDGKYRARMPDKEIDKVLKMAEKINPAPSCNTSSDNKEADLSTNLALKTQTAQKRCGVNAIVFLDIQLGFSNVETEVPLLEKYLKMPQVHLGLDPEFAMKTVRPGLEIGTLDATNINFAIEYLAKLVKENSLPPKILVIHRFTQKMVTNYKEISPLPEVQIVMDMDGFGAKANKINTYKQYIYKEPVQFTGFKLFYKNDKILLTPEELLKLTPIPSYIQYQ